MLRKLTELLKPAPYVPEIAEASEVAKQYKYWRLRILYSIYAGYVFYYFTRKGFTFAMPLLRENLGLSNAELGLIGTALYISCGISKFASGILSDRSNPRYFMAFGLILTGAFNLLFGSSSALILLVLFSACNGWFQGWGWPAAAKQLTYWFTRSERGLWWSLQSTSQNLGGALIPLLVAFLAQHWGWRWAMYVPGVLSILVGLLLIERLRDVPQSLGLPSVERFRGEVEPAGEKVQSEPTPQQPSAREILFRYVLNSKAVWIMALTFFFVYVVRQGINDWGVMYLTKHKKFSLLEAASCVSWFEVGGFLGSLVAGWSSDYFFRGRRVPVLLIYATFLVAAVAAFWLLPGKHLMVDSILMSTIGFFVFGQQVLVGLASAEIVDKKAACTANGFAGFFAYVGAAATGYPLGKIIDAYDWQGYFFALLLATAAIILLLLPLELTREKKAPGLSQPQAAEPKTI